MRAAIVGIGAVGLRAARVLADHPAVDGVTLLGARAAALAEVLEPRATVAGSLGELLEVEPDVVIVCGPAGEQHREQVAAALAAGAHVVSASDDPEDVEALLALDDQATGAGRTVVLGATVAPGMTDLLAGLAARSFARVDEIHVAVTGAAGPACARRRRAAVVHGGRSWDDGWLAHRAGSGRQICWFPDPLGGLDAYQGALADPLLLHRAFPDAHRITARAAVRRRTRLAARVGRRPATDGLAGASVEVRGHHADGSTGLVVYGLVDRPALAAGTVLGVAAVTAVTGGAGGPGVRGLGEVGDPSAVLRALAERGVRAARFTGH